MPVRLGGVFNSNRCPLGIDFGSHALKLMQLQRQGGSGASARYTLVAAAEVPLPADLPSAGAPRTEALIRLLKQAVDAGGFQGRKCVTCLPAPLVQYKNLRLPPMPVSELDRAVQFEAQDRLQVDAKASLIQYFNAGEVRQGEDVRHEVILMAAPVAAIDQHVSVITGAGLDPVAIDVVPAALARSLGTAGGTEADGDIDVIVDVGFAASKVLIVRQGRVGFYKQIDIGGRKLDEMVAKHLSLPLPDAAELRRKVQTSADAGGVELFGSTRRESVDRAIFEALRAAVGEMAREVGLCLRYYSVTFRGRRPDKALLVGGEAREPQLASLLAEGAGIGVETARPLQRVLTANHAALGEGPGFGHWAVAAGLSMRPGERSVRAGWGVAA